MNNRRLSSKQLINRWIEQRGQLLSLEDPTDYTLLYALYRASNTAKREFAAYIKRVDDRIPPESPAIRFRTLPIECGSSPIQDYLDYLEERIEDHLEELEKMEQEDIEENVRRIADQLLERKLRRSLLGQLVLLRQRR